MFLREDDTERVLVALNASTHPARFELPEGDWEAVYGRHRGTGDGRVPGVDGLVLVQRR